MRVFVLSPTFPWPLNMGSKIRIYHIVKELSRHYDVTLASLIHSDKEREEVDRIKQYCSELHVISACKSRTVAALQTLFSTQPYRVVKLQSYQFQEEVNQILRCRSFDIIWIEFLNMAIYIDPMLVKNALVVLDQHNADELMWERYAREGNWGVKIFARQNLWKLRHLQNKMLKHVNVVLSVSEQETKFMKERVPNLCQIWTVPNGVDIEYFQPPIRRANDEVNNIIMFCGSMDVTMNIDAVIRFAREIFPLIKETILDVEFWILGRNPDPRILKLADFKGIEVIGTVEDVRPYYERAKVVVAPFRYGAGTKLKILEAMAMGVPIVSTTVGCQGIEIVAGEQLLIENDNTQFAQSVIEVLCHHELQETLSTRGRRLVEEKYSWGRIMTDVIQRFESLITTNR